jgi:ABC-type polysaccharide/polyol phosphate export permease
MRASTASAQDETMTVVRSYAAGLSDLAEGLGGWRIWHLLGTSDLRRRHARSRFGQLWLTLTMGVTILALGLVWSLLWRIPLAGIFPYITVAMVLWGLITGVLNEATTSFTSAGNLFLNQRTSLSVVIYGLIYRNLIVLLYNAVIIVAVFAWFRIMPGWPILLLFPGLGLTVLFLISVAYVLAIAATRYRDAAPLIAAVTQIAYFITPVLWKPDFMPADYRWINIVNPFAVFLSIMRGPVLGQPPPIADWTAALVFTAAALLFAIPFIGRYQKRVMYWI